MAHLPPDDLASALQRIERGGKVDARGVEISNSLLEAILLALPRAPQGKPRFAEADFRGATFTGDTLFDGAIFEGEAVFGRATFRGDARFSRATFERLAGFGGATFKGYARFDGAIFERGAEAEFGGAIFERDAGFGGAIFEREAKAEFGGAVFEGNAGFREATFKAEAEFGRASFERLARFDGATFAEDASFEGTTFERARWFGPVLVLGTLRFEDVSFLQAADLDLSVNRLSLSRARFPQGANVWARWAEIIVEKADFGAPSIFGAVSSAFNGLDETELAERCRGEGAQVRSARPRLLSMRMANAQNLTVSGIDLSACRFFGAHHLDGLRLEGGSSFALTPRGFGVTRRQAIAEEHEWRKAHATRLSASDWYPAQCQLPDGVDKSPRDAIDIATIYRDLRKGREDNKDEPGAADFYYGEMEMRRLATSGRARPAERERNETSCSPDDVGEGGEPKSARPPGRLTRDRGEHHILTLYWLVSGYGLRASRALLSLLVTILVFAVLLYAWGFPTQRSFLDAVTFSSESTTSLFRAPDRPLTLAGEWLQIGLRLLGPLFFGLALLSLRGRVKR